MWNFTTRDSESLDVPINSPQESRPLMRSISSVSRFSEGAASYTVNSVLELPLPMYFGHLKKIETAWFFQSNQQWGWVKNQNMKPNQPIFYIHWIDRHKKTLTTNWDTIPETMFRRQLIDSALGPPMCLTATRIFIRHELFGSVALFLGGYICVCLQKC